MNASWFRSMSTRLLLAAALLVAAFAVSRCRMVGDTLTGVDASLVAGGVRSRQQCVHQCQKERESAARGEDRRFKAALHACRSDKTCRKAEMRRHQEALVVLRDADRRCRRSCYGEGAGTGR